MSDRERESGAPAERPDLRPDPIIERLDNGETLVVDETAGRSHTLNASAAAVWDAWRDGERALPALAARLSESTGLPADEGLVVAALAQLEDARLIEGEVPQLPVRQVSRRRLLEVAASVGAAAATLPLVESIVTPTPAMAQSAPAPAPGPVPGPAPGPAPAPAPAPSPAPPPPPSPTP